MPQIGRLLSVSDSCRVARRAGLDFGYARAAVQHAENPAADEAGRGVGAIRVQRTANGIDEGRCHPLKLPDLRQDASRGACVVTRLWLRLRAAGSKPFFRR